MKKERLYVPITPSGEYREDLAALGLQDARHKAEIERLWCQDDSSWPFLSKQGWRIATFERVK